MSNRLVIFLICKTLMMLSRQTPAQNQRALAPKVYPTVPIRMKAPMEFMQNRMTS